MNAKSPREKERIYYRFEENDDHPDECDIVECLSVASLDNYNKAGFWRRHLSGTVEPAHRKSDWYFGVWLPLICIYFDPFVFRTWSSSDGLLDEYRPFVYLLSSVSVMAMVAWLLWGERLEWLNGWFAGIFFAASAVSLVIGLILFPFSLLGLLALIGFLGFTPLVTAVVFARNGIRAIRAAEPFFERRTLFYAVTLGGLISLIVPYLLNNL